MRNPSIESNQSQSRVGDKSIMFPAEALKVSVDEIFPKVRSRKATVKLHEQTRNDSFLIPNRRGATATRLKAQDHHS
jgi:hypothetical protein